MNYLLIVNLLAFLVMGLDKFLAIKHLYRIPENGLFMLAIIGGAYGIYLGMFAFHHKTLKPKFKYGIPIIVLLFTLAFFFN